MIYCNNSAKCAVREHCLRSHRPKHNGATFNDFYRKGKTCNHYKPFSNWTVVLASVASLGVVWLMLKAALYASSVP